MKLHICYDNILFFPSFCAHINDPKIINKLIINYNTVQWCIGYTTYVSVRRHTYAFQHSYFIQRTFCIVNCGFHDLESWKVVCPIKLQKYSIIITFTNLNYSYFCTSSVQNKNVKSLTYAVIIIVLILMHFCKQKLNFNAKSLFELYLHIFHHVFFKLQYCVLYICKSEGMLLLVYALMHYRLKNFEKNLYYIISFYFVFVFNT